MDEQQKSTDKTAAENLNDMINALGSAMSQIFNDPQLKEKARDLGKAARESAETLSDRFKDEEVRAKFKEMGKAAQAFGKNVSDVFGESPKKDSGDKKNHI